MMWILFAFGSALFAGLTSILAKCGIRKTDSNVATAIRTIIVLIFSWLMVFIVGSYSSISEIDKKSLIFLILSGLSTGASWLCYFKALQNGNINKVVVIDKSSTIMTSVTAIILFNENISVLKCASLVFITVGTYLMIQKKNHSDNESKSKASLIYAFLSAIFASLTAILAKIGITDIESNLGTAIRTIVVLLMSWLVVFISGKQRSVLKVPKNELAFICLSGIATGASWLCFYKALQSGPASIVVPIDKLSILVTVAFSVLVFKEKISKKSLAGLFLITVGTLGLLF